MTGLADANQFAKSHDNGQTILCCSASEPSQWVRIHRVRNQSKPSRHHQSGAAAPEAAKAGLKKRIPFFSKQIKLTMIPLFRSIVTSPSILGPHVPSSTCHFVVRMAPRAIAASIGSGGGNALTSTFFFGETVSGDRCRLTSIP